MGHSTHFDDGAFIRVLANDFSVRFIEGFCGVLKILTKWVNLADSILAMLQARTEICGLLFGRKTNSFIL